MVQGFINLTSLFITLFGGSRCDFSIGPELGWEPRITQ